MNTAEQILVVFLSSALAVLLVLAIIICVQVIKLMKVLQAMSLRAQEFVDSAEKTADLVRSAVGQLSVMRFVHNVFDMVQKHKKKGGKGE